MAVATTRISRFAKLLSSQAGGLRPPFFSFRRELAHESSREDEKDISKEDMKQAHEALNVKNVEELDGNKQTVVTVLPDEVIEQSDNFWVPDPETGVFVPAEETEGDFTGSTQPPPHSTGNGPSVLDQTVFDREDDLEEVRIVEDHTEQARVE